MSADTENVRAILANLPKVATLRNYVVTRVDIAGAPDGTDLAYIGIGDDDLPVPRLAAYGSPVLGDVVMVLTVSGSPLILDRVLGLLPND